MVCRLLEEQGLASDYRHAFMPEPEPTPPFMHDPEEDCEICAGIALDLAEPDDEECEICAIMEKLDMPVIYHPPLGQAKCVMNEPEPDCGHGCNETEVADDCEIHAEPMTDCGYGCTVNCVSSHCIEHSGELYQPEPPEPKGCCDENPAAVRSYMQYHGITEEEAKAQLKELCGY
jgi:hypothetical protein